MGQDSRRIAHEQEEPPPGVLWWLISCDDSGLHGARFVAYGTLWMPWQRRGDFQRLMRAVRERHGYQSEIKWKKIARFTQPFFVDLVETFFRTSWLQFHCYLMEKAVIRKDLHDNDWDLARRKHLTQFLANKMKRCLRRHRGRKQRFRVWVDPIASRYKKAHEVVQIIAQHTLAQAGAPPDCIDCVIERDSRETPSIQLADLLVGAVAAAREGDAVSEAKLAVQRTIAEHIGWRDLKSDTRPEERKFNIWVFYDKTRGPRKERTRDVALRYPLPPARRQPV